MKRLASVAGILSILTVVAGLATFALEDNRFSASSVALISIGYLASSVVALVGWLLVRAPWGRWSLLTATAGGMILASTTDSTVTLLVYAVGAVGIIILAGPWLKLWVRQYSPPAGPNRIAVTLIVAAPLSPLIVGVAAYDTTHWTHWLAALTGVVSSWAFGRGLPLAIWLLRVAIPVVSLAAFVNAPMPSSFILGAGAGLVTFLSWMPGARQTTTFANPPLPSPRPPRREVSDAID